MPRIQASSVAEHRRIQRRKLIDAARDIMAETGDLPSVGEVGSRAGLARSSVYQYFESIDDLIRAVLDEVLPAWVSAVHDQVASASTPGSRAWAYIEANFALFASAEHAVAQALGKMSPPQSLDSPLRSFHATLQEPLRHALEELGEPEPELMAAYIESLILHATHHMGVFDATHHGQAHERSLARLRRLLAGYLHLPTPENDEASGTS